MAHSKINKQMPFVLVTWNTWAERRIPDMGQRGEKEVRFPYPAGCLQTWYFGR